MRKRHVGNLPDPYGSPSRSPLPFLAGVGILGVWAVATALTLNAVRYNALQVEAHRLWKEVRAVHVQAQTLASYSDSVRVLLSSCPVVLVTKNGRK